MEYKVQLRGGFSDRTGIHKINTEMQITSFDSRTRTALVNATNNVFYQVGITCSPGQVSRFVYSILSDVYMIEVSPSRSYYPVDVLDTINSTIRGDSYDNVLTVIEYIINLFKDISYSYSPASVYNSVFEKEYVGYRFIGDKITPITDEAETTEIDEALNNPDDNVSKHIYKAIAFLSDRTAPDYSNSIKESITAVETMCSIIVGKSATLGDALKQLEKNGLYIHPSLKSAFDKLYGYTSDGNGIRHAGQLGGKDSTFEEAKFMLVACSAFINYLKGTMSKVN